MRFLRRDWFRFGKFKKKKNQKWRRPTGRDNKMREKRKGYPAVVSVGYKKSEQKNVRTIHNFRELENMKKNELVVLGKVGRKKREEILKRAEEKKIKFHNMKKKAVKKSEDKNREEKK